MRPIKISALIPITQIQRNVQYTLYFFVIFVNYTKKCEVFWTFLVLYERFLFLDLCYGDQCIYLDRLHVILYENFHFSLYKGVLKFSIDNCLWKTTSQDTQNWWEYSSNLTSQHIFPLSSYSKKKDRKSILTSSKLIFLIFFIT